MENLIKIANNFIFSIDNDEETEINLKSDNVKNINDEVDEVMKEIFDSIKNKYQNNLYYKCHKLNLNAGGSYIDSPYWISNKSYQ